MKYLVLIIAVGVLGSCAICRPPRDAAEMQQRVLKHDSRPFKASVPVRQWKKQRSDGYWLVYTTRGHAPTKTTLFECKPDSAQLANLRNGTGMKKQTKI